MNFVRQGFRKLLLDRQTDRHTYRMGRNYMARRSARAQRVKWRTCT